MYLRSHMADRLAAVGVSALGHASLLLAMSALGVRYFLLPPAISGQRTVTSLNAVFSPASSKPSETSEVPALEVSQTALAPQTVETPPELDADLALTQPAVVDYRPVTKSHQPTTTAESHRAQPLLLARNPAAELPLVRRAPDVPSSTRERAAQLQPASPRRAENRPRPVTKASLVARRQPPRELELPQTQPSAASAAREQPGTETIPARPQFNPKPQYPLQAIGARLQGVVMLQLLIGADGRVRDVDVLESSGHAILDQSAVSAVRRWIFTPARQGYQHVEMTVRQPIRFRL